MNGNSFIHSIHLSWDMINYFLTILIIEGQLSSQSANKFFTYPVSDPGFFRGGRGGALAPKSAIIFNFFCRKLHENERIWTPGGGRVSLVPPLDPPMLSMVSLQNYA